MVQGKAQNEKKQNLHKLCKSQDDKKQNLHKLRKRQNRNNETKKGKQKAFGKNQRLNGKWQQPILPVGCPTSTFGAAELNFCVRNENRWDLSAIVTTMDI